MDALASVLEADRMIKKLGRGGPGGDTHSKHLKKTVEWRGEFAYYAKGKHVADIIELMTPRRASLAAAHRQRV